MHAYFKGCGGWFRKFDNAKILLYIFWKETRKEFEEKFKNAFNQSTSLVTHFDSKLLCHNDDKVSEQVTVLISGQEIGKTTGYSKDTIWKFSLNKISNSEIIYRLTWNQCIYYRLFFFFFLYKHNNSVNADIHCK